MSGLLSSINISLYATIANQQAIQVISNNVANVNTPGYRRQAIVLTNAAPYSTDEPRFSGGLQFGNGVIVDRVERFSIAFYDTRYRLEIAEAKRWETKGDILDQVESTLAEMTEGGLINHLNDFWDSWQTLAGDPSNDALRAVVVEEGQNLASSFNDRMDQLDIIYQDQNLAIKERIQEINTLASKVAALNVEISNRTQMGIGNEPNDLLDQRDRLLDRLAEVAGAVSSGNKISRYNDLTQEYEDVYTGDVNVSIGGHVLVYGDATSELVYDDGTDTFEWEDGQWSGYSDSKLTSLFSGELAGILDARAVIDDQRIGLTEVADGLINWVNDIHSTSYEEAKNAITFPPGIAAGNIWLGGTGMGANAAAISTDPDSVLTASGVAAVGAGVTELGEGNYTIETRDYLGTLQFRIKNADGVVMDIDDHSAAGVNMTNAWQDIPAGLFYNTERGLTVTFQGANVGQDAVVSYQAAGTQVTFDGSEASLGDIATKINNTITSQPEGRQVRALVVDGTLYLTPENPGTNHAVISEDPANIFNFQPPLQPPKDFFTSITNNEARTIQVNSEIVNDLSFLNTSKLNLNVAPGDGSISQFIADGRIENSFTVGSTTGVNLNEAYNSQITDLGLEINSAGTGSRDRTIIADAINQRREAISGVNLDEEAVNMMKYQKAFEASARVLNVINQMLDVLMGLGA